MNVEPIAINAAAQMLPPAIGTRSQLTEQEVRVAGIVSNNLLVLRAMLSNCGAGGTIQTVGGTLKLTPANTEAALALLIEHHENYLTVLDIRLDREGSN